MDTQGWIKLHRKLVDWEWYTDNTVFRLFIHLLLMANHQPKKWQGKTISEGELITSLSALSEETGLSIKQVRNALKKLESTGEISKKGANKYTLVKVLNYSLYQGSDIAEGQTKGNQRANEGQTKGNQRATNKNEKNVKNDKNIKNIYGVFKNVLLSDDEYSKIQQQGLNYLIDELSEYIASSGKKYKSHYATILSWSRRKPKDKLQSKPSFDIAEIERQAIMNDNFDI